MPSFSKASQSKLNTCEDDLIRLFNEVIKSWDCTIIQGHRTLQEQEQNLRNGSSTTLNSKHLSSPSEAVDVSPYPIPENWGEGNAKEMAEFYYFAGYVKGIADCLDINIRWGGDWDSDKDLSDQEFDDLVHWELV